jgi:hypothetical protein
MVGTLRFAHPSIRRSSATFVGWVERSETHQIPAQKRDGFSALYPSYILFI